MVVPVGSLEWKPIQDVLPFAPQASNPGIEPLAGWTFGLGLAAFLCCGILTGIPAIVLGHMALTKMKDDVHDRGKALAIIGLVAGYLSVGCMVLWTLFALPAMLAGAAGW